MTSPHNNSNLDDELLSAYIDGELTDAEHAEVERRLENDAAARGLVAEMRALSSTLRGLPRERVTEDIRSDVLRQIRERKFVLPTSEVSLKRRIIWPALAIAAAIMLMFIQDSALRRNAEVAKVEDRREGVRDEAARERTIPALEAPAPAAAPLEEAPAVAAREAIDDTDAAAARAPMVADAEQPATVGRALDALAADNPELGIVHLTLTDFRSGAERFDQVLESNGVQVIDDSAAAGREVRSELAVPESATNGAATATDTLSTRSSGPAFAGGVGGGGLSESLPNEPADATEPEMVLVEAPPEQIEKILYSCNSDTATIESVSIDPTASGTNREPAKQRLLEYQQYSRAAQLPEAKGYSVTPAQQGVIAVLNSPPGQQAETASAGLPSVDLPVEQGWATKLRTVQQPADLSQVQVEVNQRRSQFYAQQQAASVAKKLAKDKGASQQPMRVLFLLHPSEGTAEK